MKSGAQWAGGLAAALPGGRLLLARAAGLGRRDVAPIFMLHRVLRDPAQCYDREMAVSVASLERFLGWLREHYRVVPLSALPAALPAGGSRPLAALTFDDGWLDNFLHALPLLQRFELPATVFVALNFIGTERRFWQEKLHVALRNLRAGANGMARLSRVASQFAWCPVLGVGDLEYPRLAARLRRQSSAEAEAFAQRLVEEAGSGSELQGRAFMNWEEVRAMQAGGVEFGSHTLDHTLLHACPPAEAGAALAESRRQLEERLGTAVRCVSFPWGAMSPFTRAQAEAAGYAQAVCVEPKLVDASTDPLRLPRLALAEPALTEPANATRTFRALTLQTHLARARRRKLKRLPATTADGRLRLGFLVDDPDAWANSAEGYRGGSELQLRRVLEALDPLYFDVELYFLRAPASAPVSAWPWYVAAPANAGRRQVVLGLRRLLRQRRPALVQAMFIDSLLLGVPGAWLAGVPAILCARRNAGHWKRWHHDVALRVVNRMASYWQANARNVAELLRHDEGVPEHRIDILPNRLDLARFRPAEALRRADARRQLGLAEDAFVMVMVANLTPVKDHVTLVAAAAEVCARVPAARFLLVGEGPEEARLRREIEARGLRDNVDLRGSVANIPDYLAAADAGVHTSSHEGCSNAILEYMAAGLPVVVADIPANRDLIREGLAKAGDAASFAQALLRLFDAGATGRRELGAANRASVERFAAGDFGAKVQEHYLRAAASRRRH